jgi:hypothetical protein
MQFGSRLRIPPRFVIWSWCALTLPVWLGAQSAGRITKVAGPAFLVRPSSQVGEEPQPIAAKVEDVIHLKDALLTQDGGRIRVRLNDGSILSLGTRTKLVIDKEDERVSQSSFELQYGKIRANVVHLSRPDAAFEIRSNGCVFTLRGGDVGVDATSPTDTVVLARDGKTVMDCSSPDHEKRLEIPAGFYALSSEGTLHPLTGSMLDQLNDKFSLLNKLSDTVAVLKSRFYTMGVSGQPRHPLTAQVVPITRGRYVT